MKEDLYDLVVVGGGAAGFFAAINLVEQMPEAKIVILEKSNKVLSKVRISGGGRCNVTHACWEPRELVSHYPRGEKALLGPFHRFMCGDMMGWLSDRGVETKIEDDGRVFPESNRSETIINCFEELGDRYGIKRWLSTGMKDFKVDDSGKYIIDCGTSSIHAKNLLIATGSSPSVWKLLGQKNIEIVPSVPSLFTFNIKHPLIADRPGISFVNAEVSIASMGLSDSGPMLITHWGLSGPAILKLSAWGARKMADVKYQFDIKINWIGRPKEAVEDLIRNKKEQDGAKGVLNDRLYDLPKRFWQKLISLHKLEHKNWADLSKSDIGYIATTLAEMSLKVNGKSTFKEEFVSAGGVALDQIHFKTMEHKSYPKLFFAGEVLDIDAVTGGFNFQAAWSTAYIAAETMADRLKTS